MSELLLLPPKKKEKCALAVTVPAVMALQMKLAESVLPLSRKRRSSWVVVG